MVKWRGVGKRRIRRGGSGIVYLHDDELMQVVLQTSQLETVVKKMGLTKMYAISKKNKKFALLLGNLVEMTTLGVGYITRISA